MFEFIRQFLKLRYITLKTIKRNRKISKINREIIILVNFAYVRDDKLIKNSSLSSSF